MIALESNQINYKRKTAPARSTKVLEKKVPETKVTSPIPSPQRLPEPQLKIGSQSSTESSEKSVQIGSKRQSRRKANKTAPARPKSIPINTDTEKKTKRRKSVDIVVPNNVPIIPHQLNVNNEDCMDDFADLEDLQGQIPEEAAPARSDEEDESTHDNDEDSDESYLSSETDEMSEDDSIDDGDLNEFFEWIEGIKPVSQPDFFRVPFDRNGKGKISPEKYKLLTHFHLWWLYMRDICVHVLKCTNLNLLNNRKKEITMNELLRYMASKKIMSLIKLPDISLYWSLSFNNKIKGVLLPNLHDILPRLRYEYIRQYLRFEDYEDVTIDKSDRIWKVRKIVSILQKNVRKVIPCPGMNLTTDESYIQMTSKKCPVGQHATKKPISRGIKLQMLVDHETRCVVNFLVDDGSINEENCADKPYGVGGAIILKLVEGLPGKGYIQYADNYYGTPELALALKKIPQAMSMIACERADRGPPNSIKISFATKAKPTKAWPKGSITHCFNARSLELEEGQIYQYCYMDSGQFFLIDSAYGPQMDTPMLRRNKDGTLFRNVVPKAIADYSLFMNGVDSVNQERTGYYSPEMDHKTIKWTYRMFQGLDQIAETCAFNIFKFNHPSSRSTHLTHFKYCLELIDGMINYYNMDTVSENLRTNARGRAGAACEEGKEVHELLKCTEVFEGTGKTKRKACVRCPYLINGRRNRARDTVYYCSICKVHLHTECFVHYHNENDISITVAEEEFRSPKTPSTSSTKKRKKSPSDTEL